MGKIVLWLKQPIQEPCTRLKVIALWLIILSLTGLIFILGEGMSK